MDTDAYINLSHSRKVVTFSFRSLLLGVVPMLVVLWLMVGSLSMALQIIVVSTVCTLGIGGVFWVGMAMVLGAGLQALLPSLRAQPRKPAPSDVEPDPLKPVIDYVAAKLRSGVSEVMVRRDLERAGWGGQRAQEVVATARGELAAAIGKRTGSGTDAT